MYQIYTRDLKTKPILPPLNIPQWATGRLGRPDNLSIFMCGIFFIQNLYKLIFQFKLMKIPGILGGLGPETTARIYLALAMQKQSKEYPWNFNF